MEPEKDKNGGVTSKTKFLGRCPRNISGKEAKTIYKIRVMSEKKVYNKHIIMIVA